MGILHCYRSNSFIGSISSIYKIQIYYTRTYIYVFGKDFGNYIRILFHNNSRISSCHCLSVRSWSGNVLFLCRAGCNVNLPSSKMEVYIYRFLSIICTGSYTIHPLVIHPFNSPYIKYHSIYICMVQPGYVNCWLRYYISRTEGSAGRGSHTRWRDGCLLVYSKLIIFDTFCFWILNKFAHLVFPFYSIILMICLNSSWCITYILRIKHKNFIFLN